ncbi:MAG: hypothetical protein BV459_03990 [Thermoplasmata archaeon M11B2D]|nr:MAG: hypothetical protein BV459_03990 [Thermoplasmata archaeon M11B2D]
MEIRELNDDNFLMFAIKNYDNPHCAGMEEFEEDLNRIKYLKRLLNKYVGGGELKERLIINHIIVLTNVFGVEAAVRIMFHKLEPELFPAIKTFLIFLNLLPETVPHSGVTLVDIPLDINIVGVLRKI